MSIPLTLPPCRICSGIATGLHYGVNTCEACKAFFRRAVNEKDKYKCVKEKQCEITDRKRGNCSFCRLQKCLDQGMSLSAVRHGRYSVAIRTNTILEVKRLAEKRKGQLSDGEGSPSEMSRSPASCMSASPRNPEDGSVSPVPPEVSSSCSPKVPLNKCVCLRHEENSIMQYTETEGDVRPELKRMSNSEIQMMIMTLVSAQDQIYPNLINYFNKDYTERIQNEFYEKYKLKQQVFGIKAPLSQEEFNSIYLATGIDVDGRIEFMQRAAGHMERSIIKFISYVKCIPGFMTLTSGDKLSLIRASRYEYWLLGHYLHYNPDLGIMVGAEIAMSTEESNRIFGHTKHNTKVFEFARGMLNLNLTYEEIAILRGIVVLFRDRCPLEEPEKVESIQWKLVQCLELLISELHPNEPGRFAQYIDKLITMRDLTELNKKGNVDTERFHMMVMKSYPLLSECLASDKQEVEEQTANVRKLQLLWE